MSNRGFRALGGIADFSMTFLVLSALSYLDAPTWLLVLGPIVVGLYSVLTYWIAMSVTKRCAIEVFRKVMRK